MARVVLTGSTLTLEDVVAVARGGSQVEIDPAALDAMATARAVVDRSLAAGTPTYGVTTGVGSRKVFDVNADGHDRLLVRQHRISQGAPVAPEVVRAAALRLANALARATTVARPELASHLVAALNADRLPEIRTLGSIGQSDLAQMADLADGFLGDFELARGEAIALLNQSAFATGYAALAFADALVLLDVFDHAGALDLEALGANRNSVHPAIGEARPYPGLQSTLARLGALLEGSEVVARDLQDPLTFRTIAQQNGAARDALAFVGSQLAIELNAAQSNPLVVVPEDRVISIGNFEMQPLATALDVARLALAPVISTAAERAVKLLQRNLTGLTEGLGARPALAESALSEYGIAIQSIAVEARLLAQPVSFDLVSTTQAEGIEDRMTMAPLAARRLEEMVGLGARVASIELMFAAQACDLRGSRLGVGTTRLRDSVRRFVPFLEEGASLPDLEPLVEEIRTGEDLRLTMAGFDVHQHLWPAAFSEALSQRTDAPFLDHDVLHVTEGASAFDISDHDLATRLALLDLHEIETAVVSLQPSLGLDALDPSERDPLVRIWEDGIVELAAEAPGRIVPLAAGRPREGFAGVSIGADRLDDLEDLAPTLDGLRGRGFLFVHPVAGNPPASAPAWWPAVVDYTSQMQRAYFAWLADAQERWPDVTVVFAILAGGGPIQLERLSSRGADVRSSLHRNVFFDTASYGRRALELCIETFGVEQLVFGTDTPIVDPTPAIRAVDAFGESVARLVRQGNLIGLLQ